MAAIIETRSSTRKQKVNPGGYADISLYSTDRPRVCLRIGVTCAENNADSHVYVLYPEAEVMKLDNRKGRSVYLVFEKHVVMTHRVIAGSPVDIGLNPAKTDVVISHKP